MAESELFPDFEFTAKPKTELKVANHLETLYGLIEEVRNLEPWKTLDNDHLIGVSRSEDPQEMKLISVLGNAGEYFAIQLHSPPQGLRFYNAVLRDENPDPGRGMSNLKFLDCEFVNKEDADPRDLMALGAMGKPSRKPNSIPSLRSYRPGFLPWFLDDSEISEFIPALRLLLYHFREIEDNLETFFDWKDGVEMPTIPVLSLREGLNPDDPGNWEIQLRQLPIGQIPEPVDPKTDGYRKGYAKRKATDEIWEFGCTFLSSPGHENPDERPYFPKIVAGIHDDGQGMILVEPDMYEGHKISDAEAIQAFFKKFSDARECLPKLVRVTSETERVALQQLADRIGFQVAIEPQRFLPEFFDSLAGQGPKMEEEIQEQVDQLLENLPPGNPIRNLLEEGKYEEAFEAISQMLGSEPDNIVSGNFGNN